MGMEQVVKPVGIIGFEGANAIDILGPLEAFATAGRADCADRHSKGAYRTRLLGLDTRPFAVESGVRVVPDGCLQDATDLDTVIVPGGWGIREPRTLERIAAWLDAHAPRIRRVATVCTGVYALAATGLLDGRRVTTHWRFTRDVARRFPRLHIDGDAMFIKDGRFYTSGGITAGIDLALALIEEDLGPRAALAVAREMVMYVKRPGGQAQYSEPLRFQTRSPDVFADLIAWIGNHLDGDLSADTLAARVCLSPRHFRRRFTTSVGCTAAAFVESARLAEARLRLTESRKSIAAIAASVGFHSADVFRRRFEERFGIAPTTYRDRFTGTPRTES
jgi:transcriptional regulator GlxA family with amidase domain